VPPVGLALAHGLDKNLADVFVGTIKGDDALKKTFPPSSPRWAALGVAEGHRTRGTLPGGGRRWRRGEGAGPG